mgnify:CR=1 FL=1
MTRLSKWLLYTASYKWIYLLQIVSIILSEINRYDTKPTSLKILLDTIRSNILIITILFVLFILASIVQKCFRRGKHNTRIRYQIGENVIFEIAFSVIAYLATVLSISLNTYGRIIVIAIFVVLGWIVDLTDSIYVPIFFLTGYRIYKSDKVKIITKMTRDQYRLKLDDAVDGIEARELVQNVYIVFERT